MIFEGLLNETLVITAEVDFGLPPAKDALHAGTAEGSGSGIRIRRSMSDDAQVSNPAGCPRRKSCKTFFSNLF